MNPTVSRIAVGVDGSDCSADALRWAVSEAALHEAGVTAVLGWGFLDQHHTETSAPFDPHYNEAAATDALRRYVGLALGEEDAETVELRAVCDRPAQALVGAAADADLLVVGARGLGGFKGLLLGSVSQYCVQHSTVPVAVIRGEHDTSGGVVTAVDGSTTAQRALRWAIAEAAARKAPLQVVHAWQVPHVGYDPHAAALLDPLDFERLAHSRLDEILATEDTGGVDRIDPVLHRGAPPTAILETSKASGASLIVLGTRGRGPLKRLLLGSTANQVTHHATCPVVVVPPERQ